jgi:hypothetical protein
MECYSVVENKRGRYIVKTMDGEETEIPAEQLREMTKNGECVLVNYKMDKTGALKKCENHVAWLNAKLTSYDVNTGMCSLEVQSDSREIINALMANLNREPVFDTLGRINPKAQCEYYPETASGLGEHRVVLRWMKIDDILNALSPLPTEMNIAFLKSERASGNENFSYMTDRQFNDLIDYVNHSLSEEID